MTDKQQKELLYYLNVYKNHLVDNMTDDKIYNDPWKKDDINKLNKHAKLIKKLILQKGNKNEHTRV
jgi:ribosome-binding ATPase YchF (GTP1/OBG family)